MFKKLRIKIITITMTITTAVLVLSGALIILFSSTMRPEPNLKPLPAINYNTQATIKSDQELKQFIESDRKEGDNRLLVVLISVGATVEIIVFLIVYNLSQKVVEPVENSYESQKLFIANASHELKTPLAVIQANIEALDVDQENKKWKNNIENEITHANKLVLDLLQLAKMDVGKIKKSPVEKINLNSEIKNRVEMFKPKFSGKISFKPSAKEKTLALPKQDFLQVLDILLDNATKYGKKTISIILNENNLIIKNDGATIPKDKLEKIFERFYQTDKTKEGSGLGLAIAKALCEQNNWQIFCESNKNTTKFIVRF